MSERTYVQPVYYSKEEKAAASDSTLEDAQKASEDGQARAEELLDDELLDEIDALLEENAEQFIHGFVQKGGE